MSAGTKAKSATAGSRESDPGSTWRNVRWLSAENIRRNRLSYPSTGLAALLAGLYTMVLYGLQGSGKGWVEEAVGGSVLDLWFLAMCPALTINFVFNRDYASRFTKDNMTRRLAFLRSLPISARELVASRALVMMSSLAVTSPLFFLPPYLLSSSLSDRLGPVEYLWFVLIWIGYALFSGGFYLYTWLSFLKRGDSWSILSFLLFLFFAIGTMDWIIGVGIVSTAMDLAKSYGPLSALVVLLAGGISFLLWGLATERRLKRRDLSA